jgi:phosphoglycerol transferase MdoB-like AlkP superfamily enzyme
MHVPMMWLGGALDSTYRGVVYDKICSQIDIYPTVAKLLSVQNCDACRGKNIFNVNSKEFAYYETNMGFGWVVPEGNIIYDGMNKRLSANTISDSIILEKELNNGKAFLQTLYEFFVQ